MGRIEAPGIGGLEIDPKRPISERGGPVRERKTHSAKDEQARVTRRAILVTATRLFARDGYAKTTIAEIANAINMTHGAVLHHFPTKRDLLEAVVERLGRGFSNYRAFFQEGGDLQTVMRQTMRKMNDFFLEQPEGAFCLAALCTEFAGSKDPILAKIQQAYANFLDPLEKFLSEHPGITNPKISAVAFIGAMEGLAVQSLLYEWMSSPSQLTAALIEMFQLVYGPKSAVTAGTSSRSGEPDAQDRG